MSYETDMRYLLSELDSLKRRLQFQERLGTGLGAGWNGVSGWSYASATTITVPSGAASIYAVGDQIRYKQGGAYKYGSIIAVADTLLTVTGGSDFSVADLTITDAAFSKGGGVGHPGKYTYTPTVTYVGGTTDPTSITTDFHFTIYGNILYVRGQGYLTRGTGNRTYTIFTLPIGVGYAGGVSASMQYATIAYAETRIDPVNDQIILNHSAMSSNGYYWLTATTFI